MKTATTPEELVLDVDGEQIVIDESFLDFSDLSAEEAKSISTLAETVPLFDGDEPTPLGVAVFIYTKASRGREWGADHFKTVVGLLVSWLTGTLEEI